MENTVVTEIEQYAENHYASIQDVYFFFFYLN